MANSDQPSTKGSAGSGNEQPSTKSGNSTENTALANNELVNYHRRQATGANMSSNSLKTTGASKIGSGRKVNP